MAELILVFYVMRMAVRSCHTACGVAERARDSSLTCWACEATFTSKFERIMHAEQCDSMFESEEPEEPDSLQLSSTASARGFAVLLAFLLM